MRRDVGLAYDDDEAPVDRRLARVWAQFTLRSMRRHWLLCLAIFLGVLGVTYALVNVWPKQYAVSVRVLASGNSIINTLGAPIPRSDFDRNDDPTRGVKEILKSRPYLTQLIDSTHLMKRWIATRSWNERFGDWLTEAMWHPQNGVHTRERLISVLGDRLKAKVSVDNVVSIVVRWPDAAVATDLAQRALDLFFHMEQQSEISQINDTSSILKASLARSDKRLGRAADRVESLLRAKGVDPRRRSALPASSVAQTLTIRRPLPSGKVDSSDVQSLLAQLATTQQQIDRMTADHQKRLDDATSHLNSLLQTLGAMHPDVVAAKRAVVLARRPPAELRDLTATAAALADRIAKLRGAAPRFAELQVPMSSQTYSSVTADPDIEGALIQLRKLETIHSNTMERLDNLQTQLALSKAAFAYRYRVTQPPVFPKGAAYPNARLMWAAGILLALLGAVLAAAGRDLLPGRIIEPWQVEQLLGLKVVGQIEGD